MAERDVEGKGLMNEKRRTWFWGLPPERREKIYAQTRLWRQNNREKGRTYDQVYYQKLKLLVYSHYSEDSPPKCKFCGFNDIRALCLDHINGGGNQERKTFHGSCHLFRHLRDEGYPDGYQVLCANCNYIKAAENGERQGASLKTNF